MIRENPTVLPPPRLSEQVLRKATQTYPGMDSQILSDSSDLTFAIRAEVLGVTKRRHQRWRSKWKRDGNVFGRRQAQQDHNAHSCEEYPVGDHSSCN